MDSQQNLNYPDLYFTSSYGSLSITDQNVNISQVPSISVTNNNNNCDKMELYSSVPYKEIDWDKLPISDKTVDGWSNYIPKMKYSLLGATVFSGLFLTAPPLVVTGTVLTLGLSSFGLHRVEKNIENNKEIEIIEKKQKRLEVKDKNNYTFVRDTKQYLNDIITDEEFNIIFKYDIETLSYPDFISKHGYKSFNILNSDNCTNLKMSFIDYAKKNLCLLKVPEYSNELSFFSINNDIYYIIVSQEILRLISTLYTFDDFIERNGFDYLKWINNYDHQAILNVMLENYLLSLDVGYEKIKEYSKYSNCVTSEKFKYIIFERELNKYFNDYKTFRERNGLQLISDVINYDPHFRALIRNEFSKLLYRDLVSNDYENDRKLLDISQSEIKNILINRFNIKTIQEILHEDEGFIDCIDREIMIEDWRWKVINDVSSMSICDIAKKYPIFFSKKILTIETYDINGVIISQRLASELSAMKCFEDVVNTFPIVLFEYNIINKYTPSISSLVKSNISQYIYECMTGTNLIQKDIIEKFNLIPDDINNIYYKTKQDIRIIITKHKTSLEYLYSTDYLHDLNVKKLNKIHPYEQKLKNLNQKYERDIHTSQTYLTKIKLFEGEQKQLQDKYKKQSNEISEILIKLRELEKNDTVEKYDTVCKNLKDNITLLESIQYQISNDILLMKLHNEIKELENKKITYSNQIELMKEANKLKHDLDKLINEIKDLHNKITDESFLKKKDELSKNLNKTSVTGIIGVIGSFKDNYISFGPYELNKMIEDENSLKKKENNLEATKLRIKEFESLIDYSIDPNKLLTECTNNFLKLKQDEKFYIIQLKQKLLFDKTNDSISKLKDAKLIKEQINDFQLRLIELNRLNNKIEMDLHHINTNISIEQNNQFNFNNTCESIQREISFAEQELKLKINEAETEYTEIVRRTEYDTKNKIMSLNEQLDNNINQILNNFKINYLI